MNESKPASKLSRRQAVAGAAGVGALAAVAVTLPGVRPEAEPTAGAAQPARKPGYQVTQHVLRYYETTRV
jgi:hypothetical protein